MVLAKQPDVTAMHSSLRLHRNFRGNRLRLPENMFSGDKVRHQFTLARDSGDVENATFYSFVEIIRITPQKNGTRKLTDHSIQFEISRETELSCSLLLVIRTKTLSGPSNSFPYRGGLFSRALDDW